MAVNIRAEPRRHLAEPHRDSQCGSVRLIFFTVSANLGSAQIMPRQSRVGSVRLNGVSSPP